MASLLLLCFELFKDACGSSRLFTLEVSVFFGSRLTAVERSSLGFNVVARSAFLKEGATDSDGDDVIALSLMEEDASLAEAAVEREAADVPCCSFLAKYEPTLISSTSESSFRVNLPIFFLKFN